MSSKVSVIVPFYNNEDFVLDLLKSIETQTYSNIELICIDDGSKDETYRLLQDYEPQNIEYKVIHHEFSKGSSAARNAGLDVATGEYIYFLDSDDQISEDLLNDNIQLLNNEHSDLVLFGHQTFEVDGETIKTFYNVDKVTVYNASYFRTHYDNFFDEDVVSFFVWNKLYKRSIIEKYDIRFDENQVFGEDALFNFKYYQVMESITFNPKLYYSYIRRSNSISGGRKMDFERFKEEMKVIEELNKVLKEDYSFSVRRLVRMIVRMNRTEEQLSLEDNAKSIIHFLSLPSKKLNLKDNIKKIMIILILKFKYFIF